MDEVSGILTSPSRYFSELERGDISWFHAALGYYLASFSWSVFNYAAADVELLAALVVSAISALVAGSIGVVVYGVIWFYGGQRLIGGKGAFVDVVGTTGLALFWPGLLSLVLVPFALVLPSQSPVLGIVAGLASIAASVWSLTLCGIAVRHVAELSVGQAVAVTLWFLGVIFALGVVLAIVIPNLVR